MTKLGTFLKYFSIVSILILLWVALFVTSSVLKSADNNNLNYIPENSNTVVIIDGDNLIKAGISSAILHSEDTELMNLLENLLDKKRGQKDKKYGIKYDSDIILFTIYKDNIHYSGTLLNLTDPKKFETNLTKDLIETQVISIQDDVGLILQRSNVRNEAIDTKKLQAFSNKLISSKSSFINNHSSEAINSESAIRTWICDNSENPLLPTKNATLSMQLNDKRVNITGTTSILNVSNASEPYFALKPKDFHFSTRLFSKKFNDSIRAILGADIPSITSLSVNYRCMDFIGDPTFFLVPDADVVVQFAGDVDLMRVLGNNKDFKIVSQNEVVYGSTKFNVHQINTQTFYIGRSEFNNNLMAKNDNLVLLKGNIRNLLEFKGGGMVMKFIKLTSLYNTAETLSERIEDVNMLVDNPRNKQAKVSGTIVFKENYYAINELIKAGLRHQIIQ